MRVGFINAYGPGYGHIARCNALRWGLLNNGHELVGCMDFCDWVVVDDPSLIHRGDLGMFKCNTLSVHDNDVYKYNGWCTARYFGSKMVRAKVSPYLSPYLAWVNIDCANSWDTWICDFGQSEFGRDLKNKLQKLRNSFLSSSLPHWALCAPGHSSFERCAVGVPSLMIAWTAEQLLVANTIVNAQAGITVWNMLDEGPIDMVALKRRIKSCMDAEFLRTMGERASKLCDGKGVERTIKLMEEGCARTMEAML